MKAQTQQEELNNVKVDVGILKSIVSTFEKYFNKVDDSLKDFIATYKADITDISAQGESRRIETFRIIGDLENKVDAQGEKIATSIINLENKIVHELSKIKTEADSRIKKLEMWQYMVIGGAIIVGMFASTLFQSVIHKQIDPQKTTIEFQDAPLPPHK